MNLHVLDWIALLAMEAVLVGLAWYLVERFVLARIAPEAAEDTSIRSESEPPWGTLEDLLAAYADLRHR